MAAKKKNTKAKSKQKAKKKVRCPSDELFHDVLYVIDTYVENQDYKDREEAVRDLMSRVLFG